MNRRDLITVVGGAALGWPGAATAQQTKLRRIGVLTTNASDDRSGQANLAAFRQGLQALGWTEGRNITIDYRYSSGDASMSVQATELLRSSPDVILAVTSPAVVSLKQWTQRTPIVFVSVTDPVGQGFVESLARPGRNITGFTNFGLSMGTKWLQLLLEIAPATKRMAALIYAPQKSAYGFLPALETTAKTAGISVITAPTRSVADIEHTMARLSGTTPTGIIFLPDVFTNPHRDQIIKLAARYRLPAIYSFTSFPVAGGLIAYSWDQVDQHRQAATYVDRILRGEKPADLPVQNPTKFILSINLKTAKTLGLAVPESLLIQADAVIGR